MIASEPQYIEPRLVVEDVGGLVGGRTKHALVQSNHAGAPPDEASERIEVEHRDAPLPRVRLFDAVPSVKPMHNGTRFGRSLRQEVVKPDLLQVVREETVSSGTRPGYAIEVLVCAQDRRSWAIGPRFGEGPAGRSNEQEVIDPIGEVLLDSSPLGVVNHVLVSEIHIDDVDIGGIDSFLEQESGQSICPACGT